MAPGPAEEPPEEHSQVGSVLGGGHAAAWCSSLLAYASDVLTPFAEDCVISWMPPGIPTLQAQPWTPRLQLQGLRVISLRGCENKLAEDERCVLPSVEGA